MSEQKINKFLKHPPFQHKENAKLWQSIHELSDSFESSFMLRCESPSGHLPIENLRDKDVEKYFHGESIYKRFLSSGTTAETRSQSLFSHDGLLLYKCESLKTFRDVLKRFYKEESVQGISLIPTAKEWPTSSLAQMLTWFSEFWNVEFLNLEEFKAKHISENTWIFATPFQLVQLFDEGLIKKLPSSTVLFETGGTKGKTREVKREELYALIHEKLHLPSERIVSEYGMCELATQAYDFHIDSQERRFRFPKWVQISVRPGLGLQESEGEGALTVYDPLRIDSPLALRTQDIVRLKNQSFEILGRVPKSVLKGCSLLTELQTEQHTKPKQHQRSQATHRFPKDILQKFEALKTQALQSLTKEFHSASAANSAWEDLIESLKHTNWEESVKTSQVIANSSWFFILPNNHSIAGIYPLLLGAAADLKMTVRIPPAFENKDSFLQVFLNFLSPFAKISTVSHHFRLGYDEIPKNTDGIFVFGEDSTIQNLQKLTSIPIRGFGTGITVNAVTSFETSFAENIAKDLLSLGQRGCMSSRALFVSCTKDDLHKFLPRLQKECKRFWNASWDIMQSVALDHESLALEKKGAEIFQRHEFNDFVIAVFDRKNIQEPLYKLLSEHPFVIPVFYYELNAETMISDLENFPSLLCISACEKLKIKLKTTSQKVRICSLGKANNQIPLYTF